MAIYITRKKALEIAIEALKEKEPVPEIRQAITQLYNMANGTQEEKKETIPEEINRWVNEHGHNPIAADFISSDLPEASDIRSVFNMTAEDFPDRCYPSAPRGFKRKHNRLPKEKYMEIFRSEYARINPRTAKEYNLKRSSDTPCWETIAIHNNARGWKELLRVSGLKKSCRDVRPTEITVVSHSPELERLVKMMEEQNT